MTNFERIKQMSAKELAEGFWQKKTKSQRVGAKIGTVKMQTVTV